MNADTTPDVLGRNRQSTVSLGIDEAENLADTLCFVDDWLRRANYETLADLAGFIDSAILPSAVRDVADVFIIRLGWHVLALRRQIKQTNQQTGKQVDR
jgi:hypothetical protein